MKLSKRIDEKSVNNQIKELQRENEKLRKLCKDYQSFLEDTKQGLWYWDVIRDCYRISTNSLESYNLNFKNNKFTIHHWKKIVHPEDLDKAVENLNKVLEGKVDAYKNVYRIQTKNGEYRWVLSKGKVIKNSQGKIIKLIGTHADITEKLMIEKKLYNVAYFDSLTKLSNKEKLFKDFNNLIRSQSINTKTDLAFFFMDIDNFGYVNSILGYNEGNKIIKKFSEFLTERYPDHLVSRVSADEFIIIYKYTGDLLELRDEVEKLSQEIRVSNFIEYHDIRVSVSIGVSIYKKHGVKFYDLLKNADVALYCAKKKGKDRFEFYQEHMELKVFNYVELVNQIKTGMKKKEFAMYYQPIVEGNTGLLSGFEALIRWKHSDKGFISPETFIPIAEETGIMLMMEKWIIEEVFKQVKIWSAKREMPFWVSINLSSRGLIESDLLKFLDEMLIKYEVCSNNIELEMTETSMLKDIERSCRILEKLGDRGFKISLDDFGTGYSSLNYLKSLPITKVKLDKCFIDVIEKNEKDQFLVKSIIDLSHSFDLKVIAEGVEDSEQANLLKHMHCDYLQGYYFGKPTSAKAIEELEEIIYL